MLVYTGCSISTLHLFSGIDIFSTNIYLRIKINWFSNRSCSAVKEGEIRW